MTIVILDFNKIIVKEIMNEMLFKLQNSLFKKFLKNNKYKLTTNK